MRGREGSARCSIPTHSPHHHPYAWEGERAPATARRRRAAQRVLTPRSSETHRPCPPGGGARGVDLPARSTRGGRRCGIRARDCGRGRTGGRAASHQPGRQPKVRQRSREREGGQAEGEDEVGARPPPPPLASHLSLSLPHPPTHHTHTHTAPSPPSPSDRTFWRRPTEATGRGPGWPAPTCPPSGPSRRGWPPWRRGGG